MRFLLYKNINSNEGYYSVCILECLRFEKTVYTDIFQVLPTRQIEGSYQKCTKLS